jgi:hypothetical protein
MLANHMMTTKDHADKNVYNMRNVKDQYIKLLNKYKREQQYKRGKSGADNEAYIEHDRLLQDIVQLTDDAKRKAAEKQAKENAEKTRVQTVAASLYNDTHKTMRDRDDSTDSDDTSKQSKRSKKQTSYQQQLDRISHQLDDQQQFAREHSDKVSCNNRCSNKATTSTI